MAADLGATPHPPPFRGVDLKVFTVHGRGFSFPQDGRQQYKAQIGSQGHGDVFEKPRLENGESSSRHESSDSLYMSVVAHPPHPPAVLPATRGDRLG